ncbi:MAG: hypothetical protein KGM44_01085 [bacterium]|nr:hypothetical protein [bacterium]
MNAADLRSIAQLSGLEVAKEDIDPLVAFLDEYLVELRALRELRLPDDLEPVTGFAPEPWE